MTNISNTDGETVVNLASGWTLRSGVYDAKNPHALTSGEYVRLTAPDGSEHAYWDHEEWRTDPALVMGAILNAAAAPRHAQDTEAPEDTDEPGTVEIDLSDGTSLRWGTVTGPQIDQVAGILGNPDTIRC